MSITISNQNSNKLHDIGYKAENNEKGLADIGQKPSGTAIGQVAFGTTVNFSSLSSEFPNQYASGLSDVVTVPTSFNWRFDQEKGAAIAKPGNQGMCGSCWAISAAGIIGDNFVVSGLNVDEKGNKFIPDISTTWILSSYGQSQCGGGNPGLAFQQIASSPNGLVSNRCVDYSWCQTNETCNGDAKKHMDSQLLELELNKLIPYQSGCYFPENKHYVFKITQQPNSLAIGMTHKNGSVIKEDEWDQYKVQIKKHIMANGPVLGGFLVFENFMSGTFAKTKPNKGIYLENGVYPGISNSTPSSGSKPKSSSPTDASNYKGSHAVAIIGWGVEDDVETSPGKKEKVEYWYCRNSWTENWGDDGYFKMAMWPHNKISQFDKQVTIKTKGGDKQAGGIVSIVAQQKPELAQLDQIKFAGNSKTLLKEDPSYYKANASTNTLGSPPVPQGGMDGGPGTSPKPGPNRPSTKKNLTKKIYLYCAFLLFLILMIGCGIIYFNNKKKFKKKYIIPFVITELILLSIIIFMVILIIKI
jgi:hypothetical protein